MLAKGALAAKRRLAEGGGDRAWLEGKLDLLDLYAGQVLAQTPGKASAAIQGAEPLLALTAEASGLTAGLRHLICQRRQAGRSLGQP